MKRYNLVNNILGWVCFAIALATYLLTLEPTASFWDCPEFIAQGYKLEVGHPPGNPIFMLTARFFINFVGGKAELAAVAVNAMSGFFSALTILLLFWTITHLVRKLVIGNNEDCYTLPRMLSVFGSGLCGALMYAWSDTFWFSAVEGEVYAFSSFCTALVFWLILKWENRADQPHSDRYLVLIAYIIGISIAVHLLNLLAIPAIVLVIYYRKFANPDVKGSLVALLVSFVIVALILFGLVPGFIEVAGYFELFCVNTLGLGYNMGVLIYAAALVACFVWGIYEIYAQRSPLRMKLSFALSFLLSGIPFIGTSMWVPVVIMIALLAYLFGAKRLHVRVMNVALLSMFVIFIGYSSYALILIRSAANPPMNQNEPDNVFALNSYLSREQYGETPLLYGRTPESTTLYRLTDTGYEPIMNEGHTRYAKAPMDSAGVSRGYVVAGRDETPELTPELNMVFPRVYSSQHVEGYKGWLGISSSDPLGISVNSTVIVDGNGNSIEKRYLHKPTFAQSLEYFLVYQLNHMYWRYFMWNFAGRQNDLQGNGEVNHGNWISGIPAIDNPRLGDQSLLPDDLGKGNKGHNVFYMLPLLMGIFGLLWQSFISRKGVEQFWVVFFLFFMTGIAIVLYLNQPPGQPRERDYAFAGSFYAYAIWVGMGVAAISHVLSLLMVRRKAAGQIKVKDGSDRPKANAANPAAHTENPAFNQYSLPAAVCALAVGIFVPLQVVSQTWDDHDRSGRYTARDFGFNYLNSLDPDAIIFTNGDNDTFPLWYAQEVEGVRPDVKVVNLSYLTTDWYANQVKHPSYSAKPITTLAKPTDYAHDELQYSLIDINDATPTYALTALDELYRSPKDPRYGVHMLPHGVMYIPSNLDAAVKAGRITDQERAAARDTILIDLLRDPYIGATRGITLSNALSMDIIANSIANGWERPIYFASTVPEEYYMSFTPYMRSTGMALEVSPLYEPQVYDDHFVSGVNTDKMYRNVTEKFRWGGLDKIKSPKDIYLDESVRRMVSSTRSQIIDLAKALYYEGDDAEHDTVSPNPARAAERYAKALEILDLMQAKLPASVSPYTVGMGQTISKLYAALGAAMNDDAVKQKGIDLLFDEIGRHAQYVRYYQSLSGPQFSTLQNTDLYIYRYYLLDLIADYHEAGGDVDKLLTIPAFQKINFDRLQGGY